MASVLASMLAVGPAGIKLPPVWWLPLVIACLFLVAVRSVHNYIPDPNAGPKTPWGTWASYACLTAFGLNSILATSGAGGAGLALEVVVLLATAAIIASLGHLFPSQGNLRHTALVILTFVVLLIYYGSVNIH